MKTALALVVLVSVCAACATAGVSPNDQVTDDWSAQPIQPAASTLTTGPALVLPASGGAPLMAIPLGANVYLPVTGGPPVTGIPITP